MTDKSRDQVSRLTRESPSDCRLTAFYLAERIDKLACAVDALITALETHVIADQTRPRPPEARSEYDADSAEDRWAAQLERRKAAASASFEKAAWMHFAPYEPTSHQEQAMLDRAIFAGIAAAHEVIASMALDGETHSVGDGCPGGHEA